MPHKRLLSLLPAFPKRLRPPPRPPLPWYHPIRMNQYLFRRTRRFRGVESFLAVRVEAVLFRTCEVDDLV